jgi:hypothetical protein
MRPLFILTIFMAVAGSCCSSATPSGPTPPASTGPAAVITLRAPTTWPARVCTRCGNLIGELEAVIDLVVEETAGVGGQVTLVRVLFANASGTIEGPGTLGPEQLLQFYVPTVRVNARSSLRIPDTGVHFSPDLAGRLPATLSFTVTFRDDNGHTISADASVQITPVPRS